MALTTGSWLKAPRRVKALAYFLMVESTIGQWKDRKKHDQDPGPDRIKFVGEFKDDYSWEGIVYDKDGNAIATLSESVRKSAN